MNDKGLFRVGIYLRLSDEDRNKDDKSDDSESIKNQRHLLLDEIKKRDNFILVDEYCDEDLSGAGTYRPEFERLIKDCEDRKIDVVLCKSQSRFSRDMEMVEKYIHNKFIEWGVRFIGLADNADTNNSGNKKSRQINGLVNEWYLEDVSNNIRSAFQAKMKQGEYISPFASFGYEVSKEDNNKLVVDEDASLIVRDIFNLYLSGMGYMGIAKYLNDKNIPSPSLYKYMKGIRLNIVSNKSREDIKWSPSAVKSILTNEIYIGNLVQGKRTTVSYKNHKIRNKLKCDWIRVENTHDAIIDKEVFDKVQVMIKERTRAVKNSGCVHIFSGKVYCLECGKKMRKKNSGRNNYLVCSSNSYGFGECGNNDSIRYDVLEKIILDNINEKIETFYDKELMNKKYFCYMKNTFDDKLEVLKKKKLYLEEQYLKNNNYLKYLYEDKVNGVVTLDEFDSLKKSYTIDNIRYGEQFMLIEKEICLYESKICDDWDRLFCKFRCFDKLNRFMMEELIDKIYIGSLDKKNAEREIKIKWNF